jgi:hypothetical protein
MKRLLAGVLLLALLATPTYAASPAQTPTLSPEGQKTVPDDPTVDVTNPPVPPGAPALAMSLDGQKHDRGTELFSSLTAEQRALISTLLANNPPAALDSAAAELAQFKDDPQVAGWDPTRVQGLMGEVRRWQSTIDAGLAQILTPEQYALYQESLLPAPDDAWGNSLPESRNDCYWAYYYMYNYAFYYAYYFYLYEYYYYTTASPVDDYGYTTYDLSYNTYLYSYYAFYYSYYAYAYYYSSAYSYYAAYYTRHTQGFSYYGDNMAYLLYDWTGDSYAYNGWTYADLAHSYVDTADTYAYYCYYGPASYIQNGDFEDGPGVGWSEYSTHGWELITTSFPGSVTPHSGSYAVWLGGDYNEVSYIYQVVTIPSSSPYLDFYYWIASADYCGYDYGYVKVNGSNIATFNLCSNYNTNGWVYRYINMSSYAGQQVTLYFYSTTDSSLNSNWFIDDVDLYSGLKTTGGDLPARWINNPADSMDRRSFQGSVSQATTEPQGTLRGQPSKGLSFDPAALPLPEEADGTALTAPISLDKVQATAAWIQSLTPDQREQVRELLRANRPAALKDRTAALAQAIQAGNAPEMNPTAAAEMLADVKSWQNSIAAGLAQVLTPEQYALYQESLLPAPDGVVQAAPESQTDCYYAYYYLYNYAYYYGYYYYLNTYYAYAYDQEPYLWDNFLFGYYTFLQTYDGYQYSWYAYLYYPDSSYASAAYYYTQHGIGLSSNGYMYDYMTYTWLLDSYTYDAYVYGYYTNYYIDFSDQYAYSCMSKQGQGNPSAPKAPAPQAPAQSPTGTR